MLTRDTDKTERRSRRAAALTLILLLIGSGAAYRASASRLSAWFDPVDFPPECLAQLPLQIRDWAGCDKPLDKHVARAIKADDHLCRAYSRNGTQTVSLYIAVRRSDIGFAVPASEACTAHRPEVCYPSVGWTLTHTDVAELEIEDGSSLPVRIYRFRRHTPEIETATVAAYYVAEGRCSHDPALLRSSSWRPKRYNRYVAQVEIACRTDDDTSLAEKATRTFAAESAPHILRLFAQAADSAKARPPGTESCNTDEKLAKSRALRSPDA